MRAKGATIRYLVVRPNVFVAPENLGGDLSRRRVSPALLRCTVAGLTNGCWQGIVNERAVTLLSTAIVDLEHRADRPFEFDGLVLVHNGEIYNHIELRRKAGHTFQTTGTEVILKAYREWGTNWSTISKACGLLRSQTGLRTAFSRAVTGLAKACGHFF